MLAGQYVAGIAVCQFTIQGKNALTALRRRPEIGSTDEIMSKQLFEICSNRLANNPRFRRIETNMSGSHLQTA